MTSTGFLDYRNRVFRYYNESRYREALEVAQDAAQKFLDYDAKTSFWIACLQSHLGNEDEAIRVLQAAIKRSVWWPTEVLRDNDLDPIRDKPEFTTIEAECARLKRKQLSQKTSPDLMVRLPVGYSERKEWPALMMFHQRYGERPELSAEPWLPVLSMGVILAIPWSSQVYAHDGRSWDSPEVSEKDVKWAFSKLEEYHLDSGNVVVGGFSQGAALSIYSVLERIVQCRGFVAVAPSDWVIPEDKPAAERSRPSEAFLSLLEASDCRGLRGVIITGDKDPFFPKIQQLYRLMVEKGLDGKLQIETGLGHEYPEKFGDKLRTALDFVLENGAKVPV
jgi:alpha/beta hydrolase family protein/phospholipase/carboxylesterase